MRISRAVLLALAPAPALSAETLLLRVANAAPGSQHSIRTAGDLDDDGRADLGVGVLEDSTSGMPVGTARAYSGQDGLGELLLPESGTYELSTAPAGGAGTEARFIVDLWQKAAKESLTVD